MLRLQKYLSRLQTQTHLYLNPSFLFARSRRIHTENPQQKFQQQQQKYAEDYFEAYRKSVQGDNVIKNFRRQIFDKNNSPLGLKQLDESMDKQQNRLNQLLKQGSRQQINKNSNKILNHHLNKKKMFKGLDNKEIFKDYAQYSAYKTNHMKVENRNYESMDTIQYSDMTKRTYQFIESIPDDYQQKQVQQDAMRATFPDSYQDMTLAQYGQFLQQKANIDARRKSNQNQYANMLTGQQKPNKYDPLQQNYQDFQYGSQNANGMSPSDTPILSTEVLNQIYSLYIQGWSIREISKRFGILPMRAKFHIWCRARFYHQIMPRFGVRALIDAYTREREMGQNLGTMDYGLDIGYMNHKTQYQHITQWNKERVDSQRKPEQYTKALRKLEQMKKFDKYDQVEVGHHGNENKRHLLKEWKFYKGKRSPDHILKNKTFLDLMWSNRNKNKLYR